MSDKRTLGDIDGIKEGTTFKTRKELSESGLHRPTIAGISGSKNEGDDSIVVSGGYEDDEDNWDSLLYTGQGGNDPNTGKQIADQSFTNKNLALAKNHTTGHPVRVIRGWQYDSKFAPSKEEGQRYDGLYRVEDYWRESGKSGFKIWRYRLVKIENTRFDAETEDETDQEYGKTIRAKTNILRIVRDTSLAKEIKELYNFKCQVCGIVIEAPAGLYNEAAHIKPLGSPHNVPDSKSNIICLCPNHHVMFDNHVFSIADDFLLIGIDGKLFVHDKHRLDPDFIKYHREHYGK